MMKIISTVIEHIHYGMTKEKIEGLRADLEKAQTMSAMLVRETKKQGHVMPLKAYNLASTIKYLLNSSLYSAARCYRCIEERQYKSAKKHYDDATTKVGMLTDNCNKLTAILRAERRRTH